MGEVITFPGAAKPDSVQHHIRLAGAELRRFYRECR